MDLDPAAEIERQAMQDGLRVRLDPDERALVVEASPEPANAGRVRRVLGQALAVWGEPELADPVCLLASELVTNAFRHAQSEVKVEATLEPDRLRVAVRDQAPAVALASRTADRMAESGRGLFLVETMSSAWGVQPEAQGKRVWFEVPRGINASYGASI